MTIQQIGVVLILSGILGLGMSVIGLFMATGRRRG